MWVWIRELSFAPERADVVIEHVRNSAASRHGGNGFRGFRLLVDRSKGTALDVSYWDTEQAARESEEAGLACADSVPGVVVVIARSDHYDLAIDAG